MQLLSPVRLISQVSLLAAVGLIAGCGESGQTESANSPDSEARPRIALVMKSLANEFFSTMADGARQHQSQHANQYELIVNGIKDERDLGRQVALVEEMIAGGAKAIVIAPADSKALVPVCRRAVDAGIVVVNIDNKMDADVLAETGISIPFVGPDNRAGARVVGEHLAGQLRQGDQVAILEGVPTTFNAQQRKLGFEDAMTAAGMHIVDSQSGQWEMHVANQITAAMLSEHPDLRAILCSNDSMALGAVAAARSANRLNDIAVVGFDNISAVQQAMRHGDVMATADQHADLLAVYGIELALDILAGQASPHDRETPVDLITADSLR